MSCNRSPSLSDTAYAETENTADDFDTEFEAAREADEQEADQVEAEGEEPRATRPCQDRRGQGEGSGRSAPSAVKPRAGLKSTKPRSRP